jgi:hypothetical protein
MRVLAAFASSDEGRLYAAACERWGTDPGGIFDDDVMAINARVAFAKAMKEAEGTSEPDEHADLVEQAQRGGERIREAMRHG